MANQNRMVLTLYCPNRPGIVAAVSNFILHAGGDIVDANQFDDAESGNFFMRVVYSLASDSVSEEQHVKDFELISRSFGMNFRIRRSNDLQRVLILTSKFDHCLTDLLYRHRIGELPMALVGIVANHPKDNFSQCDIRDDVPFHYLPVTKETKLEQEMALWSLIQESRAELVILARYMQILSDPLTAKLAGRCINIHHSFLPGFKGARPYHQAYARGVKLIGATAHYVTSDLDEGPIIEQDVERITHQDTPDILIRKGRDIERRVLARAIAWHLDGRVIQNGKKTVVFRD